ncbi:alpha/beta fold hydrolase [Alginatibacterium sediminis]|uniref:Alpha/beta fold hydrolase n=1 Tax=Alginatibacterium sediminis TaxID=2164068 RepID=A0A420ENE8_9ALTE|nr:alpha/beta fold hydrolase [Alginatibacterium sediminis]RKF22183.1 alpha/beta fold hydrolase [Alginatibacterium sediminis]
MRPWIGNSLIALVFSIGVPMLGLASNSQQYSSEQQFEHQLLKIDEFWKQHARADSFVGQQELNIHFVVISHPEQADSAIVVSPGRTESYLKYTELAYDLFMQGFDVFIIDHRGQGLSDRETAYRQYGDVADFQYYVDDFSQLIETQVSPLNYTNTFLLGHSLGGAISTRYMQQNPDTFDAAVLSAPMYGIDFGNLPKWLVSGLSSVMSIWDSWFESQTGYAFGQADYQRAAFEDNQLSHSKVRYEYSKDIYDQQPLLQIGGPSNRWLKNCIAAMGTIYDQVQQQKTPLLLMQAQLDTVVDNAAQDRFCQSVVDAGTACEGGKATVIEGAWHELYFETDPIRSQVLDLTFEFYAKHRK